MTWKEFYKTKRGIYMVSNDGKILNSITGTMYKNAKNSTGYCAIKINKKWFLVHRLVAESFIGCTDGKVVHHKNNITDDNRVENLEITTQSENILYAVKAGNHKGFANLKCQNQYTKAKKLGLPKPKTKNQYT
jgi:plasmid maintenance system killer protein